MRRFAVLVAMLVPLSLFAAGCGGSSGSRLDETTKAELKKKAEEMQSKMQGGRDKMGKPPAMLEKASKPEKASTPEK